jgi:hypothetical protein
MYMKAPTTEGEHFCAKLYKRVSHVLMFGKEIDWKEKERRTGYDALLQGPQAIFN